MPTSAPKLGRAVGRDARDGDAKDGACRLLEFVAVSGSTPPRVDKAAGLIAGVKILGATSRNNREYAPAALRQALDGKLYEGKPVNVDHVENARRSYRDRIGRLEGINLREDGIYGDLRVNAAHPLAEQLFWDAEHAPQNVGLSHDARGKTAVRNGKVIVESIELVRSVDLVADPATTAGLFEDVSPSEGIDEMEIKNLTLADLRSERKDLLEAVEAEATKPLAEKLAAMETELTEARTKLAAVERKQKVSTMLREAKIDEAKLPESIRESLESAADEKLPKLIEDIGKMVGPQQQQQTQQVTSSGPASTPERFEDRVKSWA